MYTKQTQTIKLFKNENIIIKTFIYIKWTDKNKSYTNKGKCKQSSPYFYAWLCRKIVKSRFGCCHSVRFFDHRLNFNPGLKWWSIIFAQTQTVILRPKTLYNHDDKGTLKNAHFAWSADNLNWVYDLYVDFFWLALKIELFSMKEKRPKKSVELQTIAE